MTPDETIDAVMQGPFEDSHDGEQLAPPLPAVERAAREFLRALVEVRPDVTYDAGYDGMEGITIDVGDVDDFERQVNVLIWNDSARIVVCGPHSKSEPAIIGALTEAASLAAATLARLDRALLREALR